MKQLRRFGRRVHLDARSWQFPIRGTFLFPLQRRSQTWKCDIALDQGDTMACTGFSVCHEAAAEPVPVQGITNETAQEVYHRAQQLDQWDGEDYEGSSVLAAMKAGKERGWYTEYRWAFGEYDLALAIGCRGPAVLGIPWYAGMSDPDKDGLVHVAGEIQGGHAILCSGYDVILDRYRLHNSWGPGWGVNGDCFISREDLARLLKEDGEACVPIGRKPGNSEG